MSDDRVSELYQGKIFERSTQQACRDRVNWMCAHVVGEDVLDIGCSQGIAAILLGREGHRVVGVDLDGDALDFARRELAAEPEVVRERVSFQAGAADRLPFEDASFDAVLLGEILEHQNRPERLLAEARRVLRPAGRVILSVPYGHHPHPTHMRTFYLTGFVRLVTPHFQIEQLEILHKYIVATARRTGFALESPPDLGSAALLALSERAFLAAEHQYTERTDRSRDQLAELRKKAAELTAARDAAARREEQMAASVASAERIHSAALDVAEELGGMLPEVALLGAALAPWAAHSRRVRARARKGAADAEVVDLLPEALRAVAAEVARREEMARAAAQAAAERVRDLEGAVARRAARSEQIVEGLQRRQAQTITELREAHEGALADMRRELGTLNAQRERTLAELRQEHEREAAALRSLELRLKAATQKEAESRVKAQRAVQDLASAQVELRRIRAGKDKAFAETKRLQARVARQGDVLTYFKSECALKQGEVRYRLGDALVKAATSPSDFVLLPGRVANLFVEGLRRRKQRRRLEASESAPRPTNGVAAARPPAARGPGGAPSASGPLAPGAARAIESPPAEQVAASAPRAQPKPDGAARGAVAPAPPRAAGAVAAKVEAAETPAAASAERFVSIFTPDREPATSVRVAAIMDRFTHDCFKPECHLLTFTQQDWKARLERERPDVLFVESAWVGNDGAWQYQISRPKPIDSGPLFELVQWCKSRGVPTVFWNKEDPPNFPVFINAARLFDHVLTTDANCIPAYRKELGHDRIAALPFAAQPAIHNPIDARRRPAGDICFAGTYYAKKHADRREQMEMLLRPAMRRGLHIYNRMHAKDVENYRFPPAYHPAIQGDLPYEQMLDAYRQYRVFLNVNSVADSPTMFSRRVFEILASGTPVVSTYATGIEELLGADCVALARTQEEAEQWLDLLLQNPDLADRMTQRAQRRIFREHTYANRLATVLERVGIAAPRARRRVTVITCTNRPDKLENVIANYERQSHADKELVLVLNNDEFSLEQVRERLKSVRDARAVQLPERCTLGACLNAAVGEARYEYWSKFDDDNFYATNFLNDLLLPFLYADAAIVGKFAYFSYHEGPRCLALRFPGHEHQYVKLLSGSALIVDRKVNEHIRFPEKNRGEDTQFIKEAVAQGFGLYSADRFNYVVRRSKRVEDHTWQISDAEFLRKAKVLAYTDDYKAHVEV